MTARKDDAFAAVQVANANVLVLACLLVDDSSVPADLHRITVVTLMGCHELDAAVVAQVSALVYKCRRPLAGSLQLVNGRLGWSGRDLGVLQTALQHGIAVAGIENQGLHIVEHLIPGWPMEPACWSAAADA